MNEDKKIEEAVEVAEVVTEEKVAEKVEVAEKPVEDAVDKAAVELSDAEVNKEVLKMLDESETLALAGAAIENNELEFEIDGQLYRTRKASYAEKQKANNFRMKKFTHLLKDADCLLEKDLKKLYKDRGINLDNMDKEIRELTKQQQNLMLELGKGIKAKRAKPELEKYKEEIINITNSIQGVALEKQQLLEFSLENRVLMELYSYLIWMVSEKKVGDKWENIWATYDDFLNTKPGKLLTEVTQKGAIVIAEELQATN